MLKYRNKNKTVLDNERFHFRSVKSREAASVPPAVNNPGLSLPANEKE